MINSEKCPHCKGAPKRHLGVSSRICAYCMQPVKEKSDKVPESSPEEILGMESVLSSQLRELPPWVFLDWNFPF